MKIILTLALSLSTMTAWASADYSAQTIEAHVVAHLDHAARLAAENPATGHSNGLPPRQQFELESYRQTLAHIIANQDAALFNEVVAHLISDYVHVPAHREELAALLTHIRALALTEIQAEPHREAIYGLVGTAFNVWLGYGVFKLGKGLWVTRGTGLRGIPRFVAAARRFAHAGRLTRQEQLLVTVVGGSMGVGDAIIEYCSTRKLDPWRILFLAQRRLVEIYRGALESQLRALRDTRDMPIREIFERSQTVTNITLQLEELKAQSPNLAPEIVPLSLIVLEIGQVLERLL